MSFRIPGAHSALCRYLKPGKNDKLVTLIGVIAPQSKKYLSVKLKVVLSIRNNIRDGLDTPLHPQIYQSIDML